MPRIARVLCAFFAMALSVAGWRADPRAWGVHQYALLPRPAWVAAAVALFLLLVPAVAGRFGSIAVRVAGALQRSWLLILLTAAAMGVLFYLARIDFPFLGDGVAWSNALRDRSTFHNFEPLAVALTRVVCYAASSAHPERTVPLLSVLLGPVYVASTAALTRTLWQDAVSGGLAWLLLLVHPMLLLYFGYIESYPLLVLLQVLFALGLVGAARGRVPAIVPAIGLGLALAAHLSAISWIPALVAVVFSTRTHRRVLHGALLSAAAFAVAAVAIVAVGDSPLRLLRDITGHSALGGQSGRWFFSFRHLLDLVNELVLLLGPVFVLLAAIPPAAASFRSLLARPEFRCLAWLLPGPLLFACVVQPRIGGARDWDLFTPLALPALLCAVELWHTAVQPEGKRLRARPSWTAAAGLAVGLACVATIGWLGVGLDSTRSARRLLLLQEPIGLFGNFARGYANETLAIYYRNRDMTAARDAWLRATQANPQNGRYFNNLGMVELQLGHTEVACPAFRRALELGMEEFFVYYNIASCERGQKNLQAAEQLYSTCIARWPSRWEAWSARGLMRLLTQRPQEALPDLQRAAAMMPQDAETQYRLGWALAGLGRTDEARAAWENALRLNPAHPAARARLQQLGAPAP